MEKIRLNILNNQTEEAVLKKVVDLYQNGSKSGEEKFNLSSVEKLKELIRDKIMIIIATNEENVVGTIRLKEESENKFWSSGLLVAENFRGKGIGKILLDKVENLVESSKKQTNEVLLQCAISEKNTKSKDIHKKRSWENAKNEDGSVYTFVDNDKSYELWRKSF